MKVFNDLGQLLTSQVGGVPGTWTTVASGSTTVAHDTEVALTTFTPASNEMYWPVLTLREPGDLSLDMYMSESATGTVNADNEVNFTIARPAASTVYEFRVRHKLKSTSDSISGTFDWVLYKVVV